MNRVVLIGRLTKDPELKFTPGTGKAIATFSLAVDRGFSKANQKETDFIPIIVWDKLAESIVKYISKGKLIGISGRIKTRSYDAKDGSKRFVAEVVADEVQFIEWEEYNELVSRSGNLVYGKSNVPIPSISDENIAREVPSGETTAHQGLAYEVKKDGSIKLVEKVGKYVVHDNEWD